ncbi:unnamed protein product, partial [Clonostachys solani]
SSETSEQLRKHKLPPSPDLKPRDPPPEATQTRAVALVQQEASTNTPSSLTPALQTVALGEHRATSKAQLSPLETHGPQLETKETQHTRGCFDKCFDCFDQSALSNPNAGIVQVKSPFVFSRRKK